MEPTLLHCGVVSLRQRWLGCLTSGVVQVPRLNSCISMRSIGSRASLTK